MMFAITDVKELLLYLQRMFGAGAGVRVINPMDFVSMAGKYWTVLVPGVLFSTSLAGVLSRLLKNRLVEALLLLGLFWLCVYYLYMEGANPFMYFRF